VRSQDEVSFDVHGSEVEMNTKAKDLPEKLRDLQVGDDEGQVIL
jgi:hypothetical protein